MELFYKVIGQGEPIVCVSGFAANHAAWEPLQNLFPNKYQFILLDNRCIGHSSCPTTPFCIEDMATDVLKLCDFLGVEKAHFIGSSMGGFIIQNLGKIRPEIVRSLTIINSGYEAPLPYVEFAKAKLELRETLSENEPLKTLLRLELPWIMSSRFLSHPENIDMFLSMAEKNPYAFTIEGNEQQLHALSHFCSKNWLCQLKMPCLVFGSDMDLIFPEKGLRELASSLPNAQYSHLNGVGHLPHLESTKEVADTILSFYNKFFIKD
jgi:pimeloyl-ACP methyl ester carboxylesterase